MGVAEATADAGGDEDSHVQGHLAAEFGVAFDKLFEIYAPYELHRHEVLFANLAEVVRLEDVGVDEVGHEPGLADEILLELRDARVLLANQLDGDDLAEIADSLLGGFVDQSHAAFGQFAGEFVLKLVEDVLEGSRRHGPEKNRPGDAWQELCSNIARFLLHA